MARGSIRSAANPNDGGSVRPDLFPFGRTEPRPILRTESVVLGSFLFSGCHGHHFRGLIAGLGRQAREARVEVHRHPLTANADDDPVTFRIVRDKLRLVCFFLNGYYLRCFGHETG